MRRYQYVASLDAKYEQEFGRKLHQLRGINRLAVIGKISEEERLRRHEQLFPGFCKVESPFHLMTAPMVDAVIV